MKQGFDFSPITKDVEQKLLTFINTNDPVNWHIAFKLLRSIHGVGRTTAEEWMYVQFKKYKSSWFDCDEPQYFCEKYFKGKRKFSNFYSFINSFTITKARRKGMTYAYEQTYKWILDGK